MEVCDFSERRRGLMVVVGEESDGREAVEDGGAVGRRGGLSERRREVRR